MMATGDRAGSWSLTNNLNLGTLIEQAIVGYTTVPITDGADTTIALSDGATSAARHYVLELTGALTADRVLEVPAKQKSYIIYNNTTGGFDVTVKVTGQTGVIIRNGKKRIVYNTATDVVDSFTDLPANASVDGEPILTEATTVFDGVTGTFTDSVTTGTLEIGDGLLGNPAVQFSAEPTTGWYRPSTNQQGWTIAGVLKLQLTNTSLTTGGDITAAGTGTFGALTTPAFAATSFAAADAIITDSLDMDAGADLTMGIGCSLIMGSSAQITIGINSNLTMGTGSALSAYTLAASGTFAAAGAATFLSTVTSSSTITGSTIRGKNTIPTGAIMLFGSGGPLMPSEGNWFVCNGQAISRTTYATLFARIGTQYGVGDGSTTFNVPTMTPISVGGFQSIYYLIYEAV
jgi:hypothetical protein